MRLFTWLSFLCLLYVDDKDVSVTFTVLHSRNKVSRLVRVELTMSSVASLTAVMDSTKTRGTAVVNQGREDTCGIICRDENSVKGISQRAETHEEPT